MKKLIVLLLSSLLLTFSISSSAGEREVQALSRVADGALLIDVRTPGEFTTGHLTGAINIPYQGIVAALQERQIGLGQAIVVYCRSGNRSGIALQSLEKAGFTQVFNGGGVAALMRQANQP